ncbi:copper chaperone PCu(A)C [Ramlibacter sp. H39-3-26]|uniref:copper chaperone PCu(A)C n=1 Tax=Curvibacter soli TaxID=3031331 RepID=UPI0023DC20D6|nr:copper chaperone PCu(A)C [Ramlibacter sp. H39-3-26]MDF1486258.1 copper chaperone PCu(A)C [Ramlibacter sp. H39-3-26]
MQSTIRKQRTRIAALALACAATWAGAQTIEITNAWVRASVPGQSATGAFMTLKSPQDTALVGVQTPAAGVAEVHEMKMEGDVMRMRAMPALALPAGRAVELKPGGYHLMLQELKAPLAQGGSIPLTLVFQDAKGMRSTLDLQVPVAATPPAGGAGMDHTHKH